MPRYALEQSTFKNKIKPHDLLVEAVQEWFDRHGLREQVKVPAEKGGHEGSILYNYAFIHA